MPQVIARFQFKPDRAEEFCWPGTQFAEMRFDEPEEVIEFCEEFQDAIVDVTAIVNNRVISLSAQPQS